MSEYDILLKGQLDSVYRRAEGQAAVDLVGTNAPHFAALARDGGCFGMYRQIAGSIAE